VSSSIGVDTNRMGFVAEHKADQREKDNWHWYIDVDRIRDSANLTAQEADDWE